MNNGFTIDTYEQMADCPELMVFTQLALNLGKNEGAYPRNRNGATGGESCIAIKQDGSFVAFATFWQPDETAALMWLDLLWVNHAARRQGLGSMLVRRVKEAAIAAKCTVLQFGTMTNNYQMRALANTQDFMPVSTTFELGLPNGQ